MVLLKKVIKKIMSKLVPSSQVIVYQMGKCGSASIFHSLKRHHFLNVYHVHRMNREYINSAWDEHKKRGEDPPYEEDRKGIEVFESVIQQEEKRVKIICPIREPVSRNISAYFYNFFDVIKNGNNLNKLLEDFLNKYPHDVPLKWFQREPSQTINIDVFEEKFPKEIGYKIYKKNNIDLLVLKSELSDERKEEIIQDFLNIQEFTIKRFNQATNLDYAEVYSIFKKNINLPKVYIDQMCNKKYTQHFYSESEIKQIKDRWTQ